MVDDQFRGNQGIDQGRILAEGLDRVAHGGQVHHRRHAGKVLHEYACRVVGDFYRGVVGFLPADDIGQIRFFDHPAVKLSQEVFHQDLDGEG